MRPRHYCRGDTPSDTCRSYGFTPGFNEAAALLPRRSSVAATVHSRPYCFNEAAALLPRR